MDNVCVRSWWSLWNNVLTRAMLRTVGGFNVLLDSMGDNELGKMDS